MHAQQTVLQGNASLTFDHDGKEDFIKKKKPTRILISPKFLVHLISTQISK